ncbi:hypothetical protein THTE_0889 [Thermogutta terrifontis]|uniref:Uncharacterized protein n=1 Tax=Thermogutta terrifontis TaxID=1331910 RepID=A0A286RBZ3_9BACT|nr:hypothetical protein THTE_0889 [Thermogutta terrifontis]
MSAPRTPQPAIFGFHPSPKRWLDENCVVEGQNPGWLTAD